jgi:hypothetical protein
VVEESDGDLMGAHFHWSEGSKLERIGHRAKEARYLGI